MESLIVHLTDEALDIAALAAALDGDSTAGALASFTGQVRGSDGLTALELQCHRVMTRQALERIGQHAIETFSLRALLIAHRHGRMRPGEAIVHIAATAAHRRGALEAVSYVIDVLKTDAPFWKREWHGGDHVWIESTPDDQARAAKWLETTE